MASQGWFPAAARNCFLLLITLLAACGGGDSGGGGAAAPAPTAQATADQTVPVGTPTTLDGSASESPSGAPLSYQWTLTAKPAGSAASLSTPNSVRATFTPDVAGTYTGTLVVRANGVDSQPDAVSISAVTGNVAPVANAGPDRNTAPSRPITNNVQDALIADTAIRGGYVLVTDDTDLEQITKKYGGQCILVREWIHQHEGGNEPHAAGI